MLTEPHRIDASSGTPPPHFGRVLVASAGAAAPVLEQVRGVWRVVASWGRWCDEELGDWPEREQALAALPAWFAERLRQLPAPEVESWFDDLHDRSWIWWSSAPAGPLIRIDLDAESLPMSWWPLELVVEAAGAKVLRRGEWLPVERWAFQVAGAAGAAPSVILGYGGTAPLDAVAHVVGEALGIELARRESDAFGGAYHRGRGPGGEEVYVHPNRDLPAGPLHPQLAASPIVIRIDRTARDLDALIAALEERLGVRLDRGSR